MIIPNTARTKLPQADDKDFLTALELPELVVIDTEKKEFIYRMNQSRLQMYMDCPRRFFWKMVENLDVGKPILRLELGSGFHEGLAWLGAGAPIEKAVEKAIERFHRDYADIPLMPSELQEINDSDELLRRMLPAYVEQWGMKAWTPLGIEIGGKVLVGTVSINGEQWHCYLVFRLDKLVNFNRQIWIVDHKSMAKNDDREINKYAMDVQMTAYTYAATKILEQQGAPGGLNPRVQGVIVDALVKTKIPQFRRDPFYRTDEQLVEFQFDWLGWSEKMLRDRMRADEFQAIGVPRKYAFQKNTKSCYSYGTCPFLDMDLRETPALRNTFVARRNDYVDDETLLQVQKKVEP